ncbi:glycosyltransferase family 2 protein [Rhodospirillum sp. A1_3_36]|uniref:glycosyltransferase family 2 protein n=1 Tax=Rhodospirillum sp. A1_3_36 TaxID=3391666 RepID=UPI0039A6E1CF
MPSRHITLSIVVPAFNEEAVIREAHHRLVDALGGLPEITMEVVYVDDGSRDGTRAILRELAQSDSRVRYIGLSRNFGHQPAVSAGLEVASGDVVAVIDADLQDPPEVILEMLDLWRQGNDVIYGVRTARKEGFFKRFAYNVFYRVWKYAADISVPLDAGDFCLMDRQVVDVLRNLPENGRFIRGLRAWVGFRQVGLRYQRHARFAGETKYPFLKLVKLGSDGIFNFSLLPLKLISVSGGVIFLSSLLAIVVLALARLANINVMGHALDEVPGYTSIVLLLLLLSGLNMLFLGVIGEYLGRLYTETKRRPTFVIAEDSARRTPTRGESDQSR